MTYYFRRAPSVSSQRTRITLAVHTTFPDRPDRPPGRGPRRLDPADKAQLAESPVSWPRVAALFAPYRWQVLAVMILLVISSLVGLATPFLTRIAIDDALPARDLHLLALVVGGMVAVVITDFIQYVLLSVATILVSIYAVYHAGWDNIVAKVSSTMGSAGFDPVENPKFGITFLIWQVLLWFSIHTCWQTTAMRVFSTRSPEISKRVMTWTGFIYLGRGMLPMLWGAAALTLFGTGALDNGVPLPVVDGQTLAPIDAMPAMLASILGPGIKGIVVAGMLAATMSVNSSYLLGWSAVISQDIILPIREQMGKPALSSRSQIFVNRLANLFVGLFLMFWGLYYTPPGAVYLYLNITGTIYLAGTFICVIGGLYWKRANTSGGYLAMLMGAAGAIIPFFFLHWSENITGFCAFGLAALGLVLGSLIGKRAPTSLAGAT